MENFIKDKLGYGDKEFVVSNEVGILYDADETDNLPKKLSELRKLYIFYGGDTLLTARVRHRTWQLPHYHGRG